MRTERTDLPVPDYRTELPRPGDPVLAIGSPLGFENEAYIPPSAGAVSLGFAIPAATAVDVADELLADGTATHPYLGLTPGRATPQIQEALGLPARDGVLVLGVEPEGPAAAAGIRAGDVVTALGGREVRSVEDLLDALRNAEPGQRTPITVARGDGEFSPQITLGSVSG